jgi:Bacterial SCP ortholog
VPASPRVAPDPEPDVSAGRAAVGAALTALDAARGGAVDQETLRSAVRIGLRALAAKAPGRSVEVRVPPWGAVQCVAGPRHTRGTPRAVVETDPVTWVLVAGGRLEFAAAVEAGRVRASGERSDLGGLLPL